MPVKTRLPKRPRALSARREAAARILERLAALYPDAACSLNFANPFELLVATVLSAQTTDARVNAVTPELFSRFPTPAAMATADPRELEAILRPLGFYRAKTKSCLGLAASLCENYGGDVPETLRDLVTLPGVGRKTANVVLGDAFGIPGITVDTHVGRLARRALDDRLPQDHLSRPPGLPFAQTGVPLVSDRRLVPLLPPLRRG